MTIYLKCGNDRELTIDNSKKLISGAVNVDSVLCEFDHIWQGDIYCVFSRGNDVYHVLKSMPNSQTS